jgi:hypothetical protein
MSPFMVPLSLFAMVVLIVAIAELATIRNLEVDVHQKLHLAELEHQQKMRELEMELQRIKQQA